MFLLERDALRLLSLTLPEHCEVLPTPLHVACISKNHEIVNVLLDFGVDGIVVDSLGRTPFRCAVESGSARCMNALRFRREPKSISSRQVFQPDNLGQTPFHAACELGYVDVMQFLWKQGSDVNAPATVNANHVSGGTMATCKVCVTPLHLACIYAGQRDPDYGKII